MIFPVDPHVRIAPTLLRWDEEHYGAVQRQHFVVDDVWARFVREKLAQLRVVPERCRLIETVHPDRLIDVLWRVFRVLGEEWPELVTVDEGGVGLEPFALYLARDTLDLTATAEPPTALARDVADHLHRQSGPNRLWDALALCVQEDLVIVADDAAVNRDAENQDTDRQDYLEALHVCFPSHWRPEAVLGADFSAVHRPVAHSDRLSKAHPRVVRAMLDKGPFVRFVWSVTPFAQLDLHPDEIAEQKTSLPLDDPDKLAEQLYFRVERQTTLGFADLRRALFTIRVMVAPLAEVMTTPERKTRLAAALASMDDETARYKSLDALRPTLLRWLSR
ncbi:MAG: DUF3445 domain-containing protein [Trueperaceae bacterium]|nr:DUF3445 domain-containing protein [Trueperaceae bacterium]